MSMRIRMRTVTVTATMITTTMVTTKRCIRTTTCSLLRAR
jgi:hypothetical protein